MLIRGSCTALITPFKSGAIDEKRLRELVDFQIANRTVAVVPCGSTGESATLSHWEHERVLEIVVDQAKGRIAVIAGSGSNSTQEAIELTRHAQTVGADAALVIVPYYNKPTQQGMFEHFSKIAHTVSIPIIIYNIPGRTAVNMLPATVVRLVESNKNILGIKESSGSLDQASEIASALRGHKDFMLLSGEDSLSLPLLAVGAVGVISVLANIAPRDVSDMCRQFFKGNIKQAQALHYKMLPLVQALFVETNPSPIKTAMELMRMASGELRLPLTPLLPESKKKLVHEMKKYGLLK